MANQALNKKFAPFPSTYRTQAVAEILRWVKLGESGVLIGCSGSGKSNIAGYIASRPDVTQRWLPTSLDNYHFLLLDFNGLPGITTVNLYRMMLRTLQEAVADNPELSVAMKAIHAALPPSMDVLDLYWALQSAHHALITTDDQHVVWLFDCFDAGCQRLEADTLNSLRNLRDHFKDQLSYIAFTRHPLPRLRNPTEYDEFYELMSRHTCWVGPMDVDDGQWVADQVMKRYGLTLPAAAVAELFELCGGLPAFLKDAYSALAEGLLPLEATSTEWQRILLSLPGLQRNCKELWQSLSAEEQAILAALAFEDSSAQNSDRVKSYLQPIGLLTPTASGGSAAIFAQLFAEFVRSQPRTQGVTIRGGLVFRDGLPLPKDKQLARLEFRLLEYLLRNESEICSKDALLNHLFPEDEEGSSDERLTQLVRRLRHKIDTKEWPYIKTIFGRGYQLVQPAATAAV